MNLIPIPDQPKWWQIVKRYRYRKLFKGLEISNQPIFFTGVDKLTVYDVNTAPESPYDRVVEYKGRLK